MSKCSPYRYSQHCRIHQKKAVGRTGLDDPSAHGRSFEHCFGCWLQNSDLTDQAETQSVRKDHQTSGRGIRRKEVQRRNQKVDGGKCRRSAFRLLLLVSHFVLSFFGQQQLTFLHHQICSTCPSFAAVLHSARIENRVIDERTLTIEKVNEKMEKNERQGRQAEQCTS